MTESPLTELKPGQRIPGEDHEAIVDDFGRGITVRNLADYYGVSPSRIYRILRKQGIHAGDTHLTPVDAELEAVIRQHQAPYEAPEARAWIERAVRAWAGEEG